MGRSFPDCYLLKRCPTLQLLHRMVQAFATCAFLRTETWLGRGSTSDPYPTPSAIQRRYVPYRYSFNVLAIRLETPQLGHEGQVHRLGLTCLLSAQCPYTKHDVVARLVLQLVQVQAFGHSLHLLHLGKKGRCTHARSNLHSQEKYCFLDGRFTYFRCRCVVGRL